MLWSMARLRGYGLQARDGEIGAVVTALLDPRDWRLRHLVVDSARWTTHTVLVPAATLACPDAASRTIAVALGREQVKALPEHVPPEPGLLSAKSLAGRDVRCDDGAGGRVDDVIFDEMGWSVRYIVIDTGGIVPGHKAPLPPEWLREIGEDEVRVAVGAERLRLAPSVDDERAIDQAFEDELYAHYGRPPA